MVSYQPVDDYLIEVITVLILIVVDDGLVLSRNAALEYLVNVVLILIVVDDGLVLDLIRHY